MLFPGNIQNVLEFDDSFEPEEDGCISSKLEIEREINNLIMSPEQQMPENIHKLADYPELERVYARKRKARNWVNYSGKVFWICKKCRQVNGPDQTCLYCQQKNIKWNVIS